MSVLLTSQLKQGWASIQDGPKLSNQQQWGITREVLWYLLAQCERTLRFELRVQNVEQVMGDITKGALTKFMGAFDFSAAPSKNDREHSREVQWNQLSAWQSKAALEYRQPIQRISPQQSAEILRTGALVPSGYLDRLKQRIESTIGSTLVEPALKSSNSTEGRQGLYKRITREDPNLEDIYAITIGQVGNTMSHILKEAQLVEMLERLD